MQRKALHSGTLFGRPWRTKGWILKANLMIFYQNRAATMQQKLLPSRSGDRSL